MMAIAVFYSEEESVMTNVVKLTAKKNDDKRTWTVTFYKDQSPDKPSLMDTRCETCNHIEQCTGVKPGCRNGTDYVVEHL